MSLAMTQTFVCFARTETGYRDENEITIFFFFFFFCRAEHRTRRSDQRIASTRPRRCTRSEDPDVSTTAGARCRRSLLVSVSLLSGPSPAHPVPRGAFTAAYHYYCTRRVRHDCYYRIAPLPTSHPERSAFVRATHTRARALYENKFYVTHSCHTVKPHGFYAMLL